MEIVVIDGQADTWEECIQMTGSALLEKGFVKADFTDACITREKKYPTGIPSNNPIAIPHTDANHVNDCAICVLRLAKPVPFQRMDEPETALDVKLVLNLALKGENKQIEFLSKLMDLLNTDEFYNECFSEDKETVKKVMLKNFPD